MQPKLQGRTIARVSLAALFVMGSAFAANAYPDKPITFLVGAGAGGSTDAGARILGKAMEKVLGKPVVVINKPGGGGSKALVLLREAKPDGYMLAFAYAHHVAFQPHYNRKTPAYTASDFQYIGSVTAPKMSLVTLADKPWKDLKEMVAHFRKANKPITLVYSGGPGRLVGTAISRELKYRVKIIRVRGGGKSLQRVLGGHVDMVYSGGAHYQYTKAGKTKVVASVSNSRNPDYPNAPTIKESGVNAATPTLQILLAPKGIAKEHLKVLSDALIKARADKDMVNLFSKNLQMRIDSKDPEPLTKYMMNSEKGYIQLIKSFSK
jgi:tripartite-type tricarboxylate transporter receptor subunit TctC